MNQSTESINEGSFVQPSRSLPVLLAIEGAVEDPALNRVALADALACAAVGTILPGLSMDDAQDLLWLAVQLRMSRKASERLDLLAAALEAVVTGYASIVTAAQLTPDDAIARMSASDSTEHSPANRRLQHAMELGLRVVDLLRGITAEYDRARLDLAIDEALPASEGGAL